MKKAKKLINRKLRFQFWLMLIFMGLGIVGIVVMARLIAQPKEVTQTRADSQGNIYSIDFETNDFSQLTGPYTEPAYDGGLEGSWGAYFGKGSYWQVKTVTSPAQGRYAAALTIGSGHSTAAYLFTYRVPSTVTGSYQADYYVPSTIVPSSWWNIWQWKSVDNYYNKPTISLNLIKLNGVLQLVTAYVPGGISTNPTQSYRQANPIPFPTDQFVTIKGIYTAKTDNTGSVLIYQNDQLIFDIKNIITKPGNKAVLFSINSYADSISPNPATIYIDNIYISEVSPTASSPTPSPTTSPTPTPTPTPIILPSPTPNPTPTPTAAPSPSPTPSPTETSIISSPQFITTTLPIGQKSQSYQATITAIDPNINNRLTMKSSRLPKGLKFGNCVNYLSDQGKAIDCQITGTPQITASNWIVTVSVQNSQRVTTRTKLQLIIR